LTNRSTYKPGILASISLLFLICFQSNSQIKQSIQNKIIPRPLHVKYNSDVFAITPATVINYPANAKELAKFINEAVAIHTGYSLPLNTGSAFNKIVMSLDSNLIKQKEGYQLRVTKNIITITGNDNAGLFYGIQSFVQLFTLKGKQLSIPGVIISDYPRFAYRGLHLDVSRNMYPVAFIKKYIDLLAFYKLNTFHWHLTDDQGWRIEIKKYPKLQSIAAYRDETLIGHKKELPHLFDGKKYGGYYTQEEIREIVRYASLKFVTVIPEIEMPGHALAALSAYPELGCTGGPYKAATFWGIFDDVYCAGNDSAFTFMEGVLDEVVDLFPSKYIHIGGDECPKTRWKACPKCQRRIKKEHLKDEDELQSYFIRRMGKYLNSKNRLLLGWDEILEGGLTPGATVMSWRGEAGGIEAAKQKHEVIMTPESHVYFDYYQSLHPNEQTAAAGFTPLKKVYNYEPIPKELNAEDTKYVIGVQAGVWSEYLPTPQQVEYVVFPRALAFAEVAWSAKEGKDYSNFLTRVRHHKQILDKRQVNYFKNFEEIVFSSKTTKAGMVAVMLTTTLPKASIRYTLNGSMPKISSPLYKQTITVNTTSILKAQVFKLGKPAGRILEKQVQIHKAINQPVSLTYRPQGNFNADASILVNGLTGTHRYNDNQWLGFSKDDFEAVVDLKTLQNVSRISVNILKYHWQRMWEPTQLQFLASNDGINYREVYRTDKFPVNGINSVKATLTPFKARFIKVMAQNKGIIPPGEYGAGAKAWLMVDEIVVE